MGGYVSLKRPIKVEVVSRGVVSSGQGEVEGQVVCATTVALSTGWQDETVSPSTHIFSTGGLCHDGGGLRQLRDSRLSKSIPDWLG